METALLRTLIKQGMQEYYPKGILWPNGLGFNTRGWSFTYSEADHCWYASHPRTRMDGKGQNPFDAYAHAKKVPQ